MDKKITNNHASNNYFIPLATNAEFTSFTELPPEGVSVTNCAVAITTTTYSGNGCDSCPFGSTKWSTLGGYPYNTDCNKNGYQARFKYPSGVWETWSYTNARWCKTEYNCGVWWNPLTWWDICTTTFDWEMKP
ncbi:MAG: hypothetical protein AABX99_00525 [Nanoarchaeota archaeon]